MVFARSRSEQIAKQSNQLVGSVLRNRVVGLDLEIAPLTRTARAISSLPERMCCFGSWLAGRLDIGTRERELLERPLEEFPFTRTYIKATGEPRPEAAHPFWQAADRARGSSKWRYLEIETNHAIPENRPDELVALLRD